MRVLERLDFHQVGQSGSHVKMRRAGVSCIVPLHKEVKKGTLASVLRQAHISTDEFFQALTH